jgi:uncharacterized protein YegP (UPF0339 family)
VLTVRRGSLLLVLTGLIMTAGLETAPAQTKSKSKADTKTETKAESQPTGLTFELYKDSAGKFRWRLKDGEGTNIGMAPHGYETKADCQKGIDAIKAGAARAKVDDTTK